MIKISKKADYAVLVMAALAHHQIRHDGAQAPGLPDAGLPDAGLPDAGLPDAGLPDVGTPDDVATMPPVSAQDIAGEAGLSRALVANILKALTRADLLQSVRGAAGGYRLAKPLGDISLAQIISALEGPIRFVDCAALAKRDHKADVPHDCNLSAHCPSRSAMRIVHDRIAALMEDILLPELLQLDNRTAPLLRS